MGHIQARGHGSLWTLLDAARMRKADHYCLTKEKFSLRCFKYQHQVLSFLSIFKSRVIKTFELQESDWSCRRFLEPANEKLLIIPVIWWTCLRGSGLLESRVTRVLERERFSPTWCIDVMPAMVTQVLYIMVPSFLLSWEGTFLSLFIPTSFCI